MSPLPEAKQGDAWAGVTDEELRQALELAFDYRGDVTISLKDGGQVEGYIFDRRTGPTLAECSVRLFVKDRPEKVSLRYTEIAGLAMTGRDTAAGKSWEAWVRKYVEKKAAGETGIELKPESLE